MNGVVGLLKKSGYSEKAIKYYLEKINVGEISDPSIRYAYTGPCGDTIEIFLKIDSDIITDAKFQAIGCAGAFTSASALTEMITGKLLEQAKIITEEEIISYLEGIPKVKMHCACLARRTLEKAIKTYTNKKSKE